MNSAYGALLNVAFRWGRPELGASITGTGRQITTFMIEKTHELVEGTRVPVVKRTVIEDGETHNFYTIDSSTVVYSDTDSTYFITHQDNKEDAVKFADAIIAATNEAFPAFMKSVFNCIGGNEDLIKVNREVVGSAGLWQAKKKYMIHVVDNEGKAVDKVKSQGSEIRKSDTPKPVQVFLKKVVDMILSGKPESELEKFVYEQRKTFKEFSDREMIALAATKQVNNLDTFRAIYVSREMSKDISSGVIDVATHKVGARKRVNLPGHVRAAINYWVAADRYDASAKEILNGDKVIVVNLLPNQDQFTSIAFPSDIEEFPAWFLENYRIDRKTTTLKMIDNKIEGIFAAMGWELPSEQRLIAKSLLKF